MRPRIVWMQMAVAALGLAVGGALLCAQETHQPPTYADVAPIFKQHCVVCHSGVQPPEGLRLDSYAHIMAGAGKEHVVVPKKPGKSRLVARIRGLKQPRMPANGPPWLTEEEMSVIERWIQAGALER